MRRTNLIKVNCSLESSEEKRVYTPLTKESLISDFLDCFEELGTFNMKSYHIVVDPKTEPDDIQQPLRQVSVVKTPFWCDHVTTSFRRSEDTIQEGLPGITGVADDNFVHRERT